MFVVSLFEDQPLLVDASGPKVIKSNLPSAPKRNQYDEDEPISDKQAAQDAKQTYNSISLYGEREHILAGTNKGWLNIIEVSTRTTIYSTKICTGVVIYLRLTGSGEMW